MAEVYRAVCGAVRSPIGLGLPLSDRDPEFVLTLRESKPRIRPCPDDGFIELGPDRYTGWFGGGGLKVDANMRTRAVDLAPAEDLAPSALVHLVVDHVLPRLADGRGVCLHAAAVAIDGAAIVLIGESGAGKSTLAAALALTGDALIADDCALVQDGMVYATGRGCRLDAHALTLLGLADVHVDATGKGVVDERHGVHLAEGRVPLLRIIVVGERNGPLGVAQSFEMLSRQRFWLRRPTQRALLDEIAVLLADRPQMMEVDWASPNILERVRELATRS